MNLINDKIHFKYLANVLSEESFDEDNESTYHAKENIQKMLKRRNQKVIDISEE